MFCPRHGEFFHPTALCVLAWATTRLTHPSRRHVLGTYSACYNKIERPTLACRAFVRGIHDKTRDRADNKNAIGRTDRLGHTAALTAPHPTFSSHVALAVWLRPAAKAKFPKWVDIGGIEGIRSSPNMIVEAHGT